MASIVEIEGIGEAYAGKLKTAGVATVAELLSQGATPKGRKDLAQKTGIADSLILKWVNRADLFRVNGIGEQFSDLLEAAGVDSVVELARRQVENLHEKLVETNRARNLVRVVPGVERVADWVKQAKHLPRAVTY